VVSEEIPASLTITHNTIIIEIVDARTAATKSVSTFAQRETLTDAVVVVTVGAHHIETYRRSNVYPYLRQRRHTYDKAVAKSEVHALIVIYGSSLNGFLRTLSIGDNKAHGTIVHCVEKYGKLSTVS
jgi:mannose-1-phosphate guanylyltransferase